MSSEQMLVNPRSGWSLFWDKADVEVHKMLAAGSVLQAAYRATNMEAAYSKSCQTSQLAL
jgi:hypothetical protein